MPYGTWKNYLKTTKSQLLVQQNTLQALYQTFPGISNQTKSNQNSNKHQSFNWVQKLNIYFAAVSLIIQPWKKIKCNWTQSDSILFGIHFSFARSRCSNWPLVLVILNAPSFGTLYQINSKTTFLILFYSTYNFDTHSLLQGLLDVTSGSWHSRHFISGSLKLAVIRPSEEILSDHVTIMGYYADVTIILWNR